MKEKEIVERLISKKETIATMESCTAGYLAGHITNVDGSSEVLKVSLITYSNEYKIKFGVKKETIDKYSVYSNEVSREMAKCVCEFAKSTYAVGITGQINRVDPSNLYGKDNEIFITVYNSKKDEYNDFKITCPNKTRSECKLIIIDKVFDKLLEII